MVQVQAVSQNWLQVNVCRLNSGSAVWVVAQHFSLHSSLLCTISLAIACKTNDVKRIIN